jgi:hypothetical protein
METNHNKQFRNVEYRLIDEFNEESDNSQNNKVDDSLYLSAQENKEDFDNKLKNNNLKLNIRKKHDSDINPLLNATINTKRGNENHDNKYVDGTTLNSYLSITDLQQDAKENVDILRSNISKLDFRKEHIDEMEVKSNTLLKGSDKFKMRSKYLKNKMFWAHLINALLIGFFVFLIVFLIIKLT